MKGKVKKHLSAHKELYLGLCVGLTIAGITYLIMRDPESILPSGIDAELPSGSVAPDQAQTGFFIFADTINGDIATTVYNGTRGHPGFITRCIETGELFLTQSSAARSVGSSNSIMSTHLNGKLEDVNGYHFERVFT